MVNFLDQSIHAFTKVADWLKFIHIDLVAIPIGEIDTLFVNDGLSSKVELARRITLVRLALSVDWTNEASYTNLEKLAKRDSEPLFTPEFSFKPSGLSLRLGRADFI